VFSLSEDPFSNDKLFQKLMPRRHAFVASGSFQQKRILTGNCTRSMGFEKVLPTTYKTILLFCVLIRFRATYVIKRLQMARPEYCILYFRIFETLPIHPAKHPAIRFNRKIL
jgi:hypothetical protein